MPWRNIPMARTPCKGIKKDGTPCQGHGLPQYDGLCIAHGPTPDQTHQWRSLGGQNSSTAARLDKRTPERLKNAIDLINDGIVQVAQGEMDPARLIAMSRGAKALIDLCNFADQDMETIRREETEQAAAQFLGVQGTSISSRSPTTSPHARTNTAASPSSTRASPSSYLPPTPTNPRKPSSPKKVAAASATAAPVPSHRRKSTAGKRSSTVYGPSHTMNAPTWSRNWSPSTETSWTRRPISHLSPHPRATP